MKSFLTVVGGAVMAILLIILLGAYGFWASAFTIVHLWGWFVTPIFGLPAITMFQSMGLSIIVSYFTYQHYVHYTKDQRELSEKIMEIAILILRPWLVLLLGWLIHRLMISSM